MAAALCPSAQVEFIKAWLVRFDVTALQWPALKPLKNVQYEY